MCGKERQRINKKAHTQYTFYLYWGNANGVCTGPVHISFESPGLNEETHVNFLRLSHAQCLTNQTAICSYVNT